MARTGKPVQIDDQFLPRERALAQRQREAEFVNFALGGAINPTDLVKRGLLAPLRPNELNTLRRVAQNGHLSNEFNGSHIARLMLLKLVSSDSDTCTVTSLGKQRIVQAS